MRKTITLIILLLTVIMAHAQMLDPVKFTTTLKTGKTADAEIIFNGTISNGWHVYSTNLGNGGPIQASFNANKLDGVQLVGKLSPRGNEISKYDELFGMKLRYFEGHVTFVQKIRFTKPVYKINAYLEYGACNDKNCMPPSQAEIQKAGKAPAFKEDKGKETNKKTANSDSILSTSAHSTLAADSATLTQTPSADSATLWKPVVKELQVLGGSQPSDSHSLLYILLMGFVGGLLACLMPCIWPIMPMTVSFFLKRNKSKSQGIRDAITYGISIIVIYVGLGLAITLIFGGNKLNELSTNSIFNIFLFLLLVVFALSFFGWFEIKLPERWGNAVDSKASRTTGLISIFLMAFTLTLVSFSCTAPIIGLLLAEMSTSGNILGPTAGMFGFAFALALPFTLFALFPTWMKQMPKSGSWMDMIKVVLGFIELAFSLKFLSVADLAYGWHILDRETFLCLWIVIFGGMGFYLIGKLKFPVDAISGDIHKPMPVPAIMLGLCSIAFAIYMVPGLWGAPCKAISAFAPPLYTQDFNLNTKEVKARFTDYEQGMAVARQEGKPVLVDFTGFGCVNCRKMEAEVWTDPDVASKLQNDYVLISLFVDDKTPLKQPIVITENGQMRTLRTIGDKWSYLQRHKFGANAQPFYVALDNDGNPLTGSASYNEDISKYKNFLEKGLKNYKK